MKVSEAKYIRKIVQKWLNIDKERFNAQMIVLAYLDGWDDGIEKEEAIGGCLRILDSLKKEIALTEEALKELDEICVNE